MRDDAEIQEAMRTAVPRSTASPRPTGPLQKVRAARPDEWSLAGQGYGHERLDQLVTELLLGIR